MTGTDARCLGLRTRVAAATKALQAVALHLLANHRNGCVID